MPRHSDSYVAVFGASGPLATMRFFSHSNVTHCVGRITEAIVLDKDRPDVAAAIIMQLLEDGAA
jgi:hypothetical protein